MLPATTCTINQCISGKISKNLFIMWLSFVLGKQVYPKTRHPNFLLGALGPNAVTTHFSFIFFLKFYHCKCHLHSSAASLFSAQTQLLFSSVL